MDKFEYKVRAEEIKSLIAQKEYVQAAEIADTIDWRRVKSVMMLCTVSDLYKINRRYADARDMLLLAYDRHPGGRTIVYSLCELLIKTEEIVEAVEYYKEFIQIAPRDTGRYILQYKLYEAQDVSLEERISVLEELKKRDYREKWAYELAYLYHRVGLATRCVEECDELILWFGEGKYVYKAMELKMLHQPLTLQQQQKYDSRFQPRYEETAPVYEEPVPAYEEPAPVYEETTPVYEEQAPAYEEPVQDYNDGGYEGTEPVQEPAEPEEISEPEPEDFDIQVKTVGGSPFDTINLQEEIAKGLREVLGEETSDAEQESVEEDFIEESMEEEWQRLKREAATGVEELPMQEEEPVEEPIEEEPEEFPEEVIPEEEPIEEELIEEEPEEFPEEVIPEEEPIEEEPEEFPEEVIPEEEPMEEEPEEFPEEVVPEEELTDYDEVEELEEIEEVEEDDTQQVIEQPTEQPAQKAVDQSATRPVGLPEQKHVGRDTGVTQSSKPHIRNLTKEEKELFGSFVHNRTARQKLVAALDKVSMAAYTGNVIVTGDEGMNTLEMAKNIIRDVQMNDSNLTGKTAKISGEALNQKNVPEILNQLKNGALIIQKASDMNDKTAEDIYKNLQQESLGIILVLEDSKRNMNKFLAAHKMLEECFNARIDLEAMSNEELVAFGKKYAKEMEYSIDELGVLALHTRIEEMQTHDHAVTVMEVRDIMDEAIDHANRKTIPHFFDILLAKRYDEEDMVILKEKDFM